MSPSKPLARAFFAFFAFFALLLTAICLSCSASRPVASPAPLDRTSQGDSQVQSSGASAVLEPRPEQALAKVPVTPADPQWGNIDAPVTLVEISDFQCPFCARVQPTLQALKAKYGPTQLRIVWKHNPLPFHAQARPTHEAAASVFMLAGSAAFFKFHDLVFAHQDELTPENCEAWAATSGVSATALKGWLASGRAAQKVDDDMAMARRVGADGTPAFRINGVTVSGAQPLEVFVRTIDAQLLAAQQLVQSGTAARLVYATLTDRNLTLEPPAAARAPEEEDTKVWNVPLAADDPVRGPADALVTIVEWSDFQCPFCQRVEATLDELRKLYGKDLRIVWKDNPLPFHPRALPAAKLGRAVFQTKGNDAFWKLHDALFEQQGTLEDADFEALAKKQGLSLRALQPALKSDKLSAKIDASIDQANDFLARGTPHFFINGRRLAGSQPLDSFRQLIDEQLAQARALTEQGTPRAKVYATLLKDGTSPPPPEKKHLELPASAASRGNAKAPVVIQEFSDFQCPFCKHVEPTLAELESEFKGSIRVVWRHLPLPFHDNAQLAAEAAEEVLAQQGQAAFWTYHDLLFAAQGTEDGLSRVNLDALADKLGLDMKRFTAALDSHVHAAKIKADVDAANSVDINGTPGFLINDYYLSGAQPSAAFRKLIKRALLDAKKP